MQKVNSCCCGCSLKTGTLILLILTVIEALLGILRGFAAPEPDQPDDLSGYIIVYYLIVLCIAISGIYAAMQEKPVFLIPYMVWQLLSLIGGIIFMLAMLIFGGAILAFIGMGSNTHTTDPKHTEELQKGAFVAILMVEVICGIGVALGYYFFIVVLSFFKTLRSGINA